jgi:cadmium resistance protein CadD (predicted permease)
MTRAIIDALGAFFSTTLDDLLVLVYLFLDKSSDTSINYPYARIVIGQFIGFTIIVLISLIGLLLETSMPIKYIDLIGLIPFLVGSYKFYQAIDEDCMNNEKNDSNAEKVPILQNSDDAPENPEKRGYQKDEGIAPGHSEGRKIIDQNDDDMENGQYRDHIVEEANDDNAKDEAESNVLVKTLLPVLKVILDPLILESTILSLMCGSDNIVIYTSLFASESVHKVIIVISIFYGLLLFNACIALVIVKVSIFLHTV